MKFVVNVPFGLYMFFMLVAFTLAMKVAIIMFALFTLYLIWCEPKFFLPSIIVGICIKFWPVAIPVVVGICLILFAQALYVKRKAKSAALKIEHQDDASPQ